MVTLCMAVVTAFLLMAFYLHDRAVLGELAILDTERISHMVEEPVSESGRLTVERLEEQSFLRTTTYRSYVNAAAWEQRFREAAEEELLLTELVSVSVSVGEKEIALEYRGEFRFPVGGAAREMAEGAGALTGRVVIRRGMDPEELVRLCRSIRRK